MPCTGKVIRGFSGRTDKPGATDALAVKLSATVIPTPCWTSAVAM